MAYDNTNRGVLFENDRKTEDNHPDMTGKINIDGVEHWFSAWWKDGRGAQFLSLSIGKPVEARQERRDQRDPEPQRRPGQRQPEQRRAPPQRPTSRQSEPPDDFDDRPY